MRWAESKTGPAVHLTQGLIIVRGGLYLNFILIQVRKWTDNTRLEYRLNKMEVYQIFVTFAVCDPTFNVTFS